MKFALLGIDEDALNLARAVVADSRHQLLAAYDAADGGEAIRQIAPFVNLDDDWESLLLPSVADAVIVARGSDEERRADQLRKLVQAGVPLLVVQPACAAIVGYEIEMIREDARSIVTPFVPGRNHPAIDRLKELMRPSGESSDASGECFGEIEQVTIERTAANRTKENVLAMLAQDVAIVRRLLGEVTRISAMGGTKENPSYASLSVHMSGAHNTTVRWSIGPVDDHPVGKLTVVGSRGRAVVTMRRHPEVWQIDLTAPRHHSLDVAHVDIFKTAIEQFAAAVEKRESNADWLDSCQEIEIAEAVPRSLRRGRTIDLYPQQPSEEQTFKGLMASWGCLLLMLGMAVMFGFALFDGVTMPFRNEAIQLDGPREVPSRWPLLLRLWPFYPFAAFLLLQLFQLVFRSPRRPPGERAAHLPPTT